MQRFAKKQTEDEQVNRDEAEKPGARTLADKDAGQTHHHEDYSEKQNQVNWLAPVRVCKEIVWASRAAWMHYVGEEAEQASNRQRNGGRAEKCG